VSPAAHAILLLAHSVGETAKEVPPHVFTQEAPREITPEPHDAEHWLNAPTWHCNVAVLHGWLSPEHGALRALAHSAVETWMVWPSHVFMHVAARVIWPEPHDVEHWLNAPIWHWYVEQQGSAGHGVVELWQLPVQSAADTWAPCWPPVVSKHAQVLLVEPLAPQEAVLHWPEFWHWHAYVLHMGMEQGWLRSPGHAPQRDSGAEVEPLENDPSS